MRRHPILFLFIVFTLISIFIIGVAVLFSMTGVTTAFEKEPVVVVKIEGPIFESLDTLKELEKLKSDPHVKAVVLRLESPGGAVSSSQEIYDQVMQLKESKKVIVSMGMVAASGAYYIAAAADKIIANPGTVTGSIGVIMESFGLQNLIKRVEVEPRILKSGLYKDAGTPFREMTEAEKVYLQGLIDDMYSQFLSAVSQGRHIPLDQVKTLAEGKVYTGVQAQKLGLVDDLGNIYKAIAVAKSEAGLPADADVRWPREPGPFEKFINGEQARFSWHGVVEKILGGRFPIWFLDSNNLPVYSIQ